MSFTAMYQGPCGQCGGEVMGTTCIYDDDVVVHDHCPPGAVVLGDRTGMCPQCFLIHAGGCDD